MTRRRLLLSLLASVLAIALALFAAVVTLLGSDSGTRWSLRLVHTYLPALSIDNAQGNWLRGIHIAAVQWRDAKTDLRLADLNLRLHWPSLLHSELRLVTLQATELRIEPLGPSDDSPIKLPLLFLPLTLSAPDLTLHRLLIVNKTSIVSLDAIGADVRWRATTLRARNLHLGWQQLALHGGGSIGFRGDYPLRLRGELSPAQGMGSIALTTDGNLRQLLIHASSAQPLVARAEIKLATLDRQLPLQIEAQLTQPFVQALPSGELKVSAGKLSAHGDLSHIEATLAAVLDEAHYGATQLSAALRWRPEQLQADARWQLNGGELQLNCASTLLRPLQADCSGAATTLPFNPWLGGQNGDLSTSIKLSAGWTGPQWSLALQLPDLRGHIGGDAISGQLDLSSADGAQWLLPKLELASGPNKLSGHGKFGTQNQLQAAISAADLGRLHAQLGGNLSAKLLLSGEWPQPDLSGQWRGAQLRVGTTRVARTNGEFALRKLGSDDSTARIAGQDIEFDEHAALDLSADITGRRERQQVMLNARQGAHRARLQCNSSTGQDFLAWQFDCPELSGDVQIGSSHENWRNSTPLRAQLQLDTASPPALSSAELKPFCLRADSAELCLDKPLLYARNTFSPSAAHASGLPLRWASTWLPDDLHLLNDARANAQIQLQSVNPLRADASLTIAATRWEWPSATGPQRAEINAIAATATLDAQRAALNASAHSPTLGDVSARLNVADPRGRRELDGQITLEKIQLAGLAWAVQGLDGIKGEINGDIRISGNASAPLLRGQLLLSDGSASWAPLGSPFHDIHADLSFDNSSAKLGGWFALGAGGGDIDGRVTWQGAGDNWQLQVGLIAGGLSAMPLPNSTVVFSPHIETRAQPGEVRINGYVDIASADLQLKQLPPNTTDVSQDQRIVGQQTDAGATKLWADLGVNLGEQFHFRGFGADVNLSGRLKVNKAPGDTLHVNGEVRVPRGRYRAYGQRLSVRKGSFIFYGPMDNPDLNLEAVREMPLGVTDVVGLRVIGSLKTPEALLFSEPSMPDSDIAYYLLTGRKPVAGSATNQYSASGALLSLGMAGSEDRAGKLAEKFGIHDLQLGTSENSSGNTEAEVSGQLSQDLSVRYGRGLGQRSNSISFQYRLTPKLVIETISGIEDALDLLYSFEIK